MHLHRGDIAVPRYEWKWPDFGGDAIRNVEVSKNNLDGDKAAG